MRYQVASAMTNALAHAFDPLKSGGSVATPLPTQPTAPVEAPPAIVKATLVKKGFRDRDFSGSNFVKAAITFSVQFDNTGNKDIRAFDGVLSFNDLLGNRILGSKLTISDPIPAGKSVIWNGELEYNQFESKHSELRGYDIKDVSVTLQVGKVLFGDGTQVGG